MIKKIKPIIYNKRITPYKCYTSDKIQIGLKLLNNKKSVNIGNINPNLYLNYPTQWTLATDKTYSNGTISLNSNNIYRINNCLAYISLNINNTTYNSNIIRLNFIPNDNIINNNYIIFDNSLFEFDSNLITFG